MSIVIANNNENGFYIISDTKITFDEDKNPCQIKEPLKSNLKKYGILKAVILRGVVALSFAGTDIRIVEGTVSHLRKLMSAPVTFQEIYDTVKNHFESPENIDSAGSHKCDFILAMVINGRPTLALFNDNSCGKDVKSCYIGNAEVYKRYRDYNVDENILQPCGNEKGLYVEARLNIKLTPEGDIEQDTDEMKTQILRLKEIVDLGIKSDSKHESDVGSPIIGVYFNTQRKQLEYFYDMIYESHGVIPCDGQDHAIDINPYHSGESYSIIPFKYFEGVIIYYPWLNQSVVYLLTNNYLKLGIEDYNHLLLPIWSPKKITEKDLSPVIE